jgi:hypothetical protein
MDVVHHQLLQAAADPRFAYGETILTVWPPPDNFAALNAVTRVIHYRAADGAQRTATVPMPIFHALSLLSDLGPEYWVLPDRTIAGHVISGFASHDEHGVVRALLYAHDPADTQSRSAASFDITLDVTGLGWTGPASIREYRFDRTHNSPYPLINQLVGTPRGAHPSLTPAIYSQDQLAQIQNACQCHSTDSSPAPDLAGRLRLTAPIEANGCTFLRVAPHATE